MNFTGLSATLNLLKDQAIAYKEQIGFWLGRTVKPVCEKILMANPILLTVGLAATAIFSVCYIVHNYRKNSRLEKEVRQLNLDIENNKVSQQRITNLNNRVVGWNHAANLNPSKLNEQCIQNTTLKTKYEVILNLNTEAQLVIAQKASEIFNANEKITGLEAKLENSAKVFSDLNAEKSNTEKNLKITKEKFSNSCENYKITEASLSRLNSMYDDLNFENANLINIIQRLNDSLDVSIPTETNFLSEILFEEENNLRQKDKDLILNKSETYLKYRTLPKVNGLIAKLDDLILKVKEDPTRLFSIQINRIDDWSEIVEEKSTNPSANPFAEKIEIEAEEANLAGSTLNLFSKSMCLGQRALDLFDLTNLHAYYQKFQVAITLAINEKPKQDLTLEDKLILALESKK